MSIDCRCTTVEELTGAEAVEYSKKHLREVLINMSGGKHSMSAPGRFDGFFLIGLTRVTTGVAFPF